VNCSDDVIQKVMMTSKIAINIGQCLPELQSINTWYSILEFLESLNQNLKKYQKHISQADKSQNTASKVIMKSQNTFNADVGITLGSITNLFELSQGFSDKQIVFLMNSLVRIVTEHLEAKHKRNKNELPSENELISQQNLCVIWKANIRRIELISSETKNILTAYLCHNRIPYKEYGIVRVLELTKLLLARKEEYAEMTEKNHRLLDLDLGHRQVADPRRRIFEALRVLPERAEHLLREPHGRVSAAALGADPLILDRRTAEQNSHIEALRQAYAQLTQSSKSSPRSATTR